MNFWGNKIFVRSNEKNQVQGMAETARALQWTGDKRDGWALTIFSFYIFFVNGLALGQYSHTTSHHP